MLNALARGRAAGRPAEQPGGLVRRHGATIRGLEFVQECLDDGKIGGDPGQRQHLRAVTEPDPAQLVVILQGTGLSFDKFRTPDPHRGPRVERPASGGSRLQFRAEPDPDAQFFQQFPVQRRFGRLTGLHLAAGELPHAGKLRRGRAAGHEEPPRFGQGVQYCAANDANESSHALKSRAAWP